MKKSTAVSIATFLVGVTILCYFVFFHESPDKYTQQRVIRYKLLVKNDSGQILPEAKVWSLAPVSKTGFQRVAQINTAIPYDLESDEKGNQRINFLIKELAPYALKVISVDVILGIAREPSEVEGDASDYLRPERFLESDSPEIIALAKKLAADSEVDTLRNIYDWVKTNLTYAGYVADDMGARYALQSLRGDCTEYAYLYAALARASGTPARVISGYVHGKNAVLKAREYHNWVEVYVDDYWRVVDPQKQRFMTDENYYIATYITGGDDKAISTGSSQQFFGTATESVKVSMAR